MAHQLTLNTTALEELKAKAAALPAALDPTIVEDIATAISNKGVTVPDGTLIDGMAALIESIEAGSECVRGTFSTTNSKFTGINITGLGFKPSHVDVIFGDLSNMAGSSGTGTNSGTRYYLVSISIGFFQQMTQSQVGVNTAYIRQYPGSGYGAVGYDMSLTDDGFTITRNSSTKFTYAGVYTYIAYK